MKRPKIKLTELKKMGSFAIFYTTKEEELDLQFKSFTFSEDCDEDDLKILLDEIRETPYFQDLLQEIDWEG